jgi:DNA (cytosine-5)-methyltransferase 1
MGMRNNESEETRAKASNTVSTKKRKIIFRLGELFCGPGGLAFGAIRSKVSNKDSDYLIKHEWANDFDKDSCATYIRNICPESPNSVICQDVRQLSIENLSPIDAFAYGFPCNDFSIVGEQRGINGSYGPLYTFGLKVLDHFKPKFFVAENVGGITSANEGKAFKKILYDLSIAGNGYELTTNLYKFEDYGIPQSRHRMIIVGIEKRLKKKFAVPAPTSIGSHISARQAIEIPPIPSDAGNNELTKQSQIVIERLLKTKPGENAWTAELPDNLKLNVRNTRLSHIYKRLHPDKPSYTITGSGGGGTHGYHWDEPRALTNRERARLQTFPDDFIFEGSKESVRKQIGMAVPPKMVEIIFSDILKTIAGVFYKSVFPNWNEPPALFTPENLNGRE